MATEPRHIVRRVSSSQLRRRYQQGDPAAFRELVSPHLDTAYTLALRITGNPSDADEAAQDGLATALAKCRLYDPARPFRPWLLTVVANAARSRARSAWIRHALSLTGLEQTHITPEVTTAEHERDRKLRHALSTLPMKYREAISLFHLDEMSYDEMSEITGSNVSALKQRVRRGRVMLQSAVRRMYPDLEPPRTHERTGH